METLTYPWPILDTLEKMTDSELVNVDNQIVALDYQKTKGLNYPTKIGLVSS